MRVLSQRADIGCCAGAQPLVDLSSDLCFAGPVEEPPEARAGAAAGTGLCLLKHDNSGVPHWILMVQSQQQASQGGLYAVLNSRHLVLRRSRFSLEAARLHRGRLRPPSDTSR